MERINSADARWTWKGNWIANPQEGRDLRPGDQTRRASAKGAEASIAFEGTGAIISGPYIPDGGKCQVVLDGKPGRILDVYSDGEKLRVSESVWHAFGLKPGRHTLRLIVLGEPYSGSAGSAVVIDDLVVFR